MRELLLIRHGMTKGNREQRYIGVTDDPLLPESIEQLKARSVAPVQKLFCSPLTRCRQTAASLFPDMQQEILADLEQGGAGKDAQQISEHTRSMVMNLLHAHFRPEFLNRLDEIILFNPLSKDNISGIIDLIIADLNRRLQDRQIGIRLTDRAKAYVADQAYDPSFGARPLKRYIQKHVETLSARLILADKVHEGDTIVIDAGENGLTAETE